MYEATFKSKFPFFLKVTNKKPMNKNRKRYVLCKISNSSDILSMEMTWLTCRDNSGAIWLLLGRIMYRYARHKSSCKVEWMKFSNIGGWMARGSPLPCNGSGAFILRTLPCTDVTHFLKHACHIVLTKNAYLRLSSANNDRFPSKITTIICIFLKKSHWAHNFAYSPTFSPVRTSVVGTKFRFLWLKNPDACSENIEVPLTWIEIQSLPPKFLFFRMRKVSSRDNI